MKTLLAISFIAASSPLFAAQPPEKKGFANDKDLVAAPPIDWIKTYSLSPYSELWTLTVSVGNYDRDLPKVMQILESEGATLTIPMGQNVGSVYDRSQQLSYKLSEKGAKDAVKKLKKFDSKTVPRMMHNGELVSVKDVAEKLDKLTNERNMHRAELNSMPSISTMVDEMIQHLAMVKKVRETVETQVLLNMTVRERR